MAYPFHTIGHSTRSIDEFVALLRVADVSLVVDVRTIKRSRTNPQFNSDALPASLAPFGIGYEHVAELGGLRGKARDIPRVLNAFWINQSFHNYADYALSAEFQSGLKELVSLGRERRCAVMCAETLWWRCHRKDRCGLPDQPQRNRFGPDKVELAKLTESAVARDDGTLVYPPSPPPT